MGTLCDPFRPRLISAALTLMTAPAVYFTSSIDSPASYALVRFFTGFSLATFVSTQFWMSTMFSPKVVGSANGIAAGWGNLGGGLTQLLMPIVYEIILKTGSQKFTAWRIAFFVPGISRPCQHLPSSCLGKTCQMEVSRSIDNIIAQYYFDRFDMQLHTAGIIAASFGLANIFARPGGGWASDVMAKQFGMRGRLGAGG